ncbi:MAG: DegT/DnrJ/EryC1/StrS family aminotransferase [Gammaproteobacteria bacterium]|nr:DegT/DnrJ/EryC1/StrS family aminotransferase [Gammaproteobacteria bacterium]
MSKAYDVVRLLESEVAEFCSAPFGVAVESCSAAIFLCLKYLQHKNDLPETIKIPRFTYPSVANAVIHCGSVCDFHDAKWQKDGYYVLRPTNIVDSAKYMAREMYKRDGFNKHFVCLSFHAKKTVPVGRGGMILTDDKNAVEWLKCARFDGRHEKALHEDTLAFAGWNMMLTPEQAARGLELMQWLKDENLLPPDPYTDLSKYSFYKL